MRTGGKICPEKISAGRARFSSASRAVREDRCGVAVQHAVNEELRGVGEDLEKHGEWVAVTRTP